MQVRGLGDPARRAAPLLVLPALLVILLGWSQHVAPPASDWSQFSFGPVAGRAVFLPMPPMDQMMMPMAEGGSQGDDVQVVLQLRNDTDAMVTVPFAEVRLLAADGSRIAPTEGLQGDLDLRPHSVAEERLRFTTDVGATLHITVPDRSTSHVLAVPVQR